MLIAVIGSVLAIGTSLPACGTSDCISCEGPGESRYVCSCPGQHIQLCARNLQDADWKCQVEIGHGENCYLVGELVCDGDPGLETDTDGGYSGWDPGAGVYFDGRIYHVAKWLIDDVKANPRLLLLDGTRLEATSSGFVLQGVQPDDLAAHLGFSTGDVPLRIRIGRLWFPLATWDELLVAYAAAVDASDLDVVFQRGQDTLRHAYRIQP